MVTEDAKASREAMKAIDNMGTVEKAPSMAEILHNAGRGSEEPIKKAQEADYRPAKAKMQPHVTEIVMAQSDSCSNVAANADASIKKKYEEIAGKNAQILQLASEINSLRKDIHNLTLMRDSAELQRNMLIEGHVQ